VLVVDSQIHLFEGYGAPHHGSRPYPVEQALADMDIAGVDAAINHPPFWNPESHAYAIEAARRHPDRIATLAWVDLTAPDAPERVRAWRETPGWIGLRFVCMSEQERSWPTDGTMDWLWPLAEELGIPIALGGPLLLPLVEGLAQRYPQLRLTVDHLGFVAFTEDHRMVQHEDVLAWSRFENVAVKLSGLPDYAGGDPYPYTRLHEPVERLLDAYGPSRLFWGSDITRLPSTWRECVTVFTESMPFLSASDLSLVMGEAFCAWHDWWPAGRAASAESDNHEVSP